MSNVFSIYNAGTAYDRGNTDLIAELFNNTDGREGETKVLNAGPGSSESVGQLVTSSDPNVDIPGKAMSDAARMATMPFMGPASESVAQIVRTSWSYASGNMAGYGMEERVQATLKHLRALSPKPNVVNMTAWSRGCVTSIKLAHRIFELPEFDDTELNLLLIDPVPGPISTNLFNWLRSKTAIPEKVRSAFWSTRKTCTSRRSVG